MQDENEGRWDSWSFRFASRFVRLPADILNATNRLTYPLICRLDRRARIRLALHYWIGWNQLCDSIATSMFAVENVTLDRILQAWCRHWYCINVTSCSCPARLLPINDGQWTRPMSRTGHNPSSTLVHGVPLSWAELAMIDPPAASEAAALGRSYGYDTTGTGTGNIDAGPTSATPPHS